MSQILINVISAIVSAIILRYLGLKKSASIKVVSLNKVGWFWKLVRLIGKFLFYYGLLVFLTNLSMSGVEALNTRVGLSVATFGTLFWSVSRLITHFKEN
jgi:hypothetical protein